MHPNLSKHEPDTNGLRAVCIGFAFVFLSGCSPSLNWRDARPKGLDVLATFPCKPQQVTQQVALGGTSVGMSMTGCEAAGMTFALAHADMGSASRVGPALAQLRRDALANVVGRIIASRPVSIDHARADIADALDMDIAGRGPDGKPLKERVVLFAQDAQLYQATVLGADDDFKDDAARTFAASIRLPAAH